MLQDKCPSTAWGTYEIQDIVILLYVRSFLKGNDKFVINRALLIANYTDGDVKDSIPVHFWNIVD